MDILKKTYKKHNGQFAKVRDWCIKHQGSWQYPKRIFKKMNDEWRVVYFPEGAKEIKVNLVVSARAEVYKSLDLITLMREQTPYTEDFISVYPFSVNLTIEEGATIVGEPMIAASLFYPALSIGGLAGGSSVRIDNYGNIYGKGGYGGINQDQTLRERGASFTTAGNFDGFDGGMAIKITSSNVTINNHSTGKICGGGSGGAAGLPLVRSWTNSIDQDGGPKGTSFGGPVPAPGTTNGVPIKKSWIVMDISVGGFGGGGAPNGRVSAWSPNLYNFHQPRTSPVYTEAYKIIAMAMDPYVTNQTCETDSKNSYFKDNGLDEQTIGISKYYPEADTPQDPIFGPVGIIDNAETNLNNYKWKVKGTWFGKFWASRPLRSDHVTKTIEVDGPVIRGSKERDNGAHAAVANTEGTTAGGGVGAQIVWSDIVYDNGVMTNWNPPTISDWGGYFQGDSCTNYVNAYAMWAAHSTQNSIFGSYSDGRAGGDIGEDGEGYTYPSQSITSPYGGELVAFPEVVVAGGKAGEPLEYDIEGSNVSIVNYGTIKGTNWLNEESKMSWA